MNEYFVHWNLVLCYKFKANFINQTMCKGIHVFKVVNLCCSLIMNTCTCITLSHLNNVLNCLLCKKENLIESV